MSFPAVWQRASFFIFLYILVTLLNMFFFLLCPKADKFAPSPSALSLLTAVCSIAGEGSLRLGDSVSPALCDSLSFVVRMLFIQPLVILQDELLCRSVDSVCLWRR